MLVWLFDLWVVLRKHFEWKWSWKRERQGRWKDTAKSICHNITIFKRLWKLFFFLWKYWREDKWRTGEEKKKRGDKKKEIKNKWGRCYVPEPIFKFYQMLLVEVSRPSQHEAEGWNYHFCLSFHFKESEDISIFSRSLILPFR